MWSTSAGKFAIVPWTHLDEEKKIRVKVKKKKRKEKKEKKQGDRDDAREITAFWTYYYLSI